MHRSVIVGVVALALVAVGVSSGAGAVVSSPTDGAHDADPSSPEADASTREPIAWERQEFDSSSFDSTRFEIAVYANGSATWTIEYRRILAPGDEEDEFAAFAETFREEETDLYDRFTEQADSLLATGSEHTDREMEAAGFERWAGIEHRPNPTGVVEMSFTWENFARVNDGVVRVGDVFDGGLYIGPDQTLTVSAGDDLVFTSVRPEADQDGASARESGSVIWNGERDFLDGRPSLVLEPADSVDGTDPDGGDGSGIDDDSAGSTDGDATGGDPSNANASDGWRWLAAGLALALVGAVGAAAWHRFGGDDGPPAEAGGDDGGPDPDPIPDEELLTDEDRVVSLIRENGGRMKQVHIVEETGWSKSKVSMLLSEMESDGTISKLRVGRENIISLEGFEPEATKSPFEEN